MAPTLQELINGKDAKTIKAEIITLLAKNGFDATDWESGSESRTFLEVESQTLAELWTTVTKIAEGMYLDTATDGWLTLLAKSQYQIDRTPAEYTKGIATFSLVIGGGPRTISAGEVIVSDGLGHNFVTDNPIPVTLTSIAPSAQLEIISQTTGASNNVAQGAITTVNQGPADIVVQNTGLPVPAIIQNNGIPTSFAVHTQTFNYQVTVDGVTGMVNTLTFGANYATLAALVVALNGNATFAANLKASAVATKLQIETKKIGPQQGLRILGTGTANVTMGFLSGTDTTAVGGTTIDSPASLFSALLAGPFNISGKTLIITIKQDGVNLPIDTVTFASNYNTIDAVIAAWPGGPGYKTYNNAGRLEIRTIKPGPAQSIFLSFTGTANQDFGFSTTLDSVVVGTSAWIIQEGRDEETDDSLKARCKAKWGILGAGVADAFTTWAREADPKVQKVVVYSNYMNGTPKAGAVTVYIAGINSALDPVTVNTVYNYILAKIPIMSDLYVGSVNIVPVYYTGILTISSNVNTPAYISGFKNNVNAYSQSLQIGQSVLKKRIEAEIISALRPGIINLDLTQPTAPITTIDKNEMCVIVENPATPMTIIVK